MLKTIINLFLGLMTVILDFIKFFQPSKSGLFKPFLASSELVARAGPIGRVDNK